jgi:molybdopterin converting factor subunit 1
MQITVHFFAGMAEAAGKRSHELTLAEPATVADLIRELTALFPQAREWLERSLIAVNQEFAGPQTSLKEQDEVAVIPPVSGGSGEADRFVITDEPLSADRMIALVSNPYAGAVLTFVGTVREFTNGQRTVYLEYEAYREMAIKKMKEIAREIDERWPGAQVAIAHRTGRLHIEEIAVIIAVATAHRAAAFEAGRYAIERLKQIVPIWKKEIWEDGSEWVGHQQGPWNPMSHPQFEEKGEGS